MNPNRLISETTSCRMKFSRRHLTRSCTRPTTWRRFSRCGVPLCADASLRWARDRPPPPSEEPRIVYLPSGREIGKRFQADINTNLRIRCRPGIGLQLTFHADAHKPFACRRPLHRGRLGDAGERSVHHHLNVPELGEDESGFRFLPVLDVKAVVVLLEGEALIAQARSEAGMPRLQSIFYTPEKAFKGPIYPLEDILQDLRVHLGQFRAYLFACGQFSALVRVAKRDARHAVGITTFLQRGVIGLASRAASHLFSMVRCFFCRVESVLQRLVHLKDAFFLGQAQPETVPSTPQRNAPFIPITGSQGLSGAGLW